MNDNFSANENGYRGIFMERTINRLGTMLLCVQALFLFSALAVFAQGAGPDDIYGGPGPNRNSCTPYHLYPADHPEYTIEFEAWPEIDPNQFGFWTTQGNIQQYITSDGAHYDVNTWTQGMSMIWPRGSAFAVVKSCCFFFYTIGEFNARAPKDTITNGAGSWVTGGWGEPGRIPEDLSYRETGKLWPLQGERKVWTSSRSADLSSWPPEFSDENGEPIVLGDEDVVTIYSPNAHKRYYKSNHEWEPYIYNEVQERVVSFSASAARDIVFHLSKIVNKSRYTAYEGMGPFDWEEFHMGANLNTTIGQGGDQRVCWVDSLRLAFTYLESFYSPNLNRATPFVGYTVLRSMPMDNGSEAPLASVSFPKAGGAWGWPQWQGTPTTQEQWWKILCGKPGFRDIQDPGANYENPKSAVIRRSVMTAYDIHPIFGSENLTVCPDDTTYFDYALICAWPETGDPVSNISTAEGLALESRGMLETAKLAQTLYKSDFKLPRPPASPAVKLIPGDGKVTITWDDQSVRSRDDFYDVYLSQGAINDYREHDFEGYRVYRSTTGRVEDAVMLAQFDLKNGIVLETGVSGKNFKVATDDGGEEIRTSTEMFDTLGVSDYDGVRGAKYGLGRDTGLRFMYVDRYEEIVAPGEQGVHPLTNGYRYFYGVTAYDWNGTDITDLATMNSQESPLQFNINNMTIPRSDASSYQQASIPTSSYEINVVDGSGNLLDRTSRDILVEGSLLTVGAEVTNALQDPYISIVNADLIDGDRTYYVAVDSIIGVPDSITNPLVDPDYDPTLWNRVYVSLLDGQTGEVLCRNDQMIEVNSGNPAHFYLFPQPEKNGGVPFNVEFDIYPPNTDLMVWNQAEVLVGETPDINSPDYDKDIEVKEGFNNGNNSIPVGYRAADLELEWVEIGDSLTLSVTDLTHNVSLPFSARPGAGWCFVRSWGRFKALAAKFREEITEADSRYLGADKVESGEDLKTTVYLCGMQITIKTEIPPKNGDKWLVRSNYGAMPVFDETTTDSTGYLTADTRPAVTGIKYVIPITDDSDNASDVRMSEIRVVPNPYLVTSAWDYSPQSKRISFINLPSRAVIRIYTITGNLVQVLDHNGLDATYSNAWKGGTEYWDLKNRFNMLIASGWYIYHVTDVRTGEKYTGKFAVIQ